MARTSEAGKLICDCGCLGALSVKQVANSNRFLYGHKPVTLKHPKGSPRPRAPYTHPAAEVNLKLMTTFVDTQLKSLKDQRDAAGTELAATTKRYHELQERFTAWEAVYTALIGTAVAE